MAQFDYNITAVDRTVTGRTTPAQIKRIIEQPRNLNGASIPGIAIEYRDPNNALEMELYEGRPGIIGSTSDLGRLIKGFDEMGIPDISENEFGAIIEKFILLRIAPMRTGASVSYKRWPQRFLTDQEVATFFDKLPPLAFLNEHKAVMETALRGTPVANLQAELLTADWATDMEVLDDALSNGTLVDWITHNTKLKVTGDKFV